MNFTTEELRRLWLDLYRDEVTRLAAKGVDRDSLHPAASAHADRHIERLADKPQAPAAEMERVPVESLKEGDRVLLLGTVKDLADGSDWDAARALVRLDGDEMGDGSTTLRGENVVYRAPAQMGDEP